MDAGCVLLSHCDSSYDQDSSGMARTIAKMPARTGGGNRFHARMTVASSASIAADGEWGGEFFLCVVANIGCTMCCGICGLICKTVPQRLGEGEKGCESWICCTDPRYGAPCCMSKGERGGAI